MDETTRRRPVRVLIALLLSVLVVEASNGATPVAGASAHGQIVLRSPSSSYEFGGRWGSGDCKGGRVVGNEPRTIPQPSQSSCHGAL